MKRLARTSSFIFALLATLSGRAMNMGAGVVFSAKKYSSNLQTGITHGEGDVKIKVGLQEIEADEVEMQSQKSLIVGKGHVKFTNGTVVITGDELMFDVSTGLGEFKRAILKKGDELFVEARELSRVGEFRYQGTDVKVSSCLDCPQSWSVTGSYADVEVEGYAEIHHALIQIKDSPVLYFPVFVFPIKTKRQSGLLPPQLFSFSPDLGSRFRLPYYWAPRDDFDSTSTYEYATKGGHRLSSEFRYQYSDRSYLTGNASYGRNLFLGAVPNDRFGYSLMERYQVESNWTERFRGDLGSDTRYSSHYADEFSEALRPFLINEPSVSYQNDRSFAYGLVRFHRDNVIRSQSTVAGLDRLPEFGFYRPFEKIWGPFYAEAEGHFLSLRRKGPSVDEDSGWVREGDRLGMQSRVFMGSNFMDVINYSPEVYTRVDAYQFPNDGVQEVANAYRAKVNFSQKISGEIFRIYSVNDAGDLKAVKHSIVPRLSWSFSPPEAKTDDHPFFMPKDAPRFDLFDPDSPDAQQITLGTVTEEQKLRKHHLLTLGLDTRVLGRYGAVQKSYAEFFVVNVDQDVDLADYGGLERDIPSRFSPLRVSTLAQYGGLKLTTNMAIDFSKNTTDILTDLSYSWSRYSVSVSETSQATSKTSAVSASVSNYGPWSLGLHTEYDLAIHKTIKQVYDLNYGSPSQCWNFHLTLSKQLNQEDPGKFTIDPRIAPILSAGIKGKFL